MITQFQSIADALAGLQADVQAENTVIDSAVTLIQGIPNLIQQAVTDALTKGATADQLAAFDHLSDSMAQASADLAAAIAQSPGGAGAFPKQTGSGT